MLRCRGKKGEDKGKRRKGSDGRPGPAISPPAQPERPGTVLRKRDSDQKRLCRRRQQQQKQSLVGALVVPALGHAGSELCSAAQVRVEFHQLISSS